MKAPALSFLIIFITTLLSGCGGGGPENFDGVVAGVNTKMVVDGSETTEVPAGDQATVYLALLDSDGIPYENVAMVLEASTGILSASSVTTNSNGEASVTLSPPTDLTSDSSGTLTITAATGDTASLSYQFLAGTTVEGPGGDTATAGINLSLTVASSGEATYSSKEDFNVDILLLDANGAPIPQTLINVSATSGNVSQGTLLSDENGEAHVNILAPDNLTSGTAPGTFTASSETGLTASVNYEFIATNTVDEGEEIPAASIQFISAFPELISLKGTGGVGYGETSQGTYTVVDDNGDAVQGANVTFELSTSVGGLSLSDTAVVSNISGEASTTVQAGTIPTPVRVTATLSLEGGDTVFVQSDLLTVTTGIPDQNSFTLTLETFAPETIVDAGNGNISLTAGVEVPVTVFLADRNNNDIPDGTVVNFTTEGGSIGNQGSDGSCTTVESTCSVTWRSQNPVPADHRVQIIAYAVGHETYYDVNANGIFDDGFDYQGGDGVVDTPAFDDMTEAYRDDDESGHFNPSASSFAKDERFIDYNSNQSFDIEDGTFNGVPCEDPSGFGVCPDTAVAETTLTHIRAEATLIMADSYARTYIQATTGASCLDSNGKFKNDGTCSSNINFAPGADFAVIWLMTEDTAALCHDGTGSGTEVDPYIRQEIVDPNDPACTVAVRQSPATGSTLEVTTDVGELTELPIDTIDNTLSNTELYLVLKSSPDNTEEQIGTVEFTVTSPSGKKSTQLITVTDPVN
ncbi:Big-1 domain-containing protein [uncultured Thiomicrorhabdus sp.]